MGRKPFLRKAGEKRLGRFLAALKSAARSPGEKAVHDLRVAIRRLFAFLDLAESLTALDRPFSREMFEELAALMRPLGRLRDTHVKILRLQAFTPLAGQVTWQYALAVQNDVEKWETAVLKALKLARRNPFPEALHALPISPAPAKTLGKAAMAQLHARETEVTRLAGTFRRVRSPESLHALRLAFKRYRYTAEALATLLPGLTDETGARLNDFQTLLGDIHDFDVMLADVARFRVKVLGLPGHESGFETALAAARNESLESLHLILQKGTAELFAERGRHE